MIGLTLNQREGEFSYDTITIGIDLAKVTFLTCTLDVAGRVILGRDLNREAFSHWLSQVPAGTVVAMEAFKAV